MSRAITTIGLLIILQLSYVQADVSILGIKNSDRYKYEFQFILFLAKKKKWKRNSFAQ